MQEIVHETQALLTAAEPEPFVLVTLLTDQGSTPRSAGAEMLIRADGSIAGTVGGGLLEATAMSEARTAIEERRSTLITVELTGRSVDDPQMLCGGQVRVLVSFVPAGDAELSQVCSALTASLEAGRPARFLTIVRCADPPGRCDTAHSLLEKDRVVAGASLEHADLEGLFVEGSGVLNRELPDSRELHAESIEPRPVAVVCGAGHVGQALAPVAAAVGFDVVVIDDRGEFASGERFPSDAKLVVPPDFEHAFESVELGERSFVVVVTRGHTHDFTVLEQVLRTKVAYIGLMASSRKRTRFFETLLERGFSQEDLERVHSPIGLAIDAETPAELAISIVAELIKVRAELRR
jgi:xanthine dehydrogenase accessory factor